MSRRRLRPRATVRATVRAAALAVLALVPFLAGCLGDDGIETAWREYRAAVFSDDRAALRGLLASDVAASLDGPEADLALAAIREMTPAGARVTGTESTSASARLLLEADGDLGPMTGEVELVRESGRWKVRHESWNISMSGTPVANVDLAAVLAAAPTPDNFAAVVAHEGDVTEAAFTRDGLYVATIGYGDFRLRLWDAETTELAAEAELERRPQDLCMLPDGSALAVVDAYGNVTVWPLGWGEFGEPRTLQGDAGSSSQIAVDPTGRWLATTDFEGPVRLWDLETGTIAKELPRSDQRRGVVFAPAGPVVVCGGLDNRITAWDPDAKFGGARTYKVKSASDQSDIWSVDVTRDGRRLASGHMDSSISIWDLERGKQIHDFYTQNASVHDVQFSPCGLVLAAAGQDGRVRFWETETRRMLASLDAHDDGATAVAFNLADGVTIATGGGDGVLRLWRPSH